MTDRISVSDTNFQIHVNKNSTFSEQEFNSLVAHEIKTHVGRAYYEDKMGLSLFRIGLKGEIELNKGLAIFNLFFKWIFEGYEHGYIRENEYT